MNVGMLWFDNDRHTPFEQKVKRAASYYRQKYGRMPTLCYVHPSMLAALTGITQGEAGCKIDEVFVRVDRAVRPNHFWIGVNSDSEEATKPATKVSRATSTGSSPLLTSSSRSSKRR